MLSQDIYGCHFLDLFSGSGAIGIEALSRGAASAVFVEHNRQAVTCIRDNLTKTKLMPQAEIMAVDCQTAIDRLKNEKRHFDIVFMDPPYNKQLEKEMLEKINKLGIGPQGFGGKPTAIGLIIETMPTHIAGMPCAVNINCHVTRHKTEVL